MQAFKNQVAEAVSPKYIRAVAFNNEQERRLSLKVKRIDKSSDFEAKRMRRKHKQLCTELTCIHIRTPSFIGTTFPSFLEPEFQRKRNRERLQRELEAQEARQKRQDAILKRRQSRVFDRDMLSETETEGDELDLAYQLPFIQVGPAAERETKDVKHVSIQPLPQVNYIPKPVAVGKSDEAKKNDLLGKLPTAMKIKIERVTQSMTMLDMLEQHREQKDATRHRELEERRWDAERRPAGRAPPRGPASPRKHFRVCMNPKVPRNYRDLVIHSLQQQALPIGAVVLDKLHAPKQAWP